MLAVPLADRPLVRVALVQLGTTLNVIDGYIPLAARPQTDLTQCVEVHAFDESRTTTVSVGDAVWLGFGRVGVVVDITHRVKTALDDQN